jgi:predicted nucleic-acid-binding Zn-ribbon protein
MNGAITLHLLYACMVLTGATLRFHINHTVSQTHKCNSTDAHNKTIAFAAPIFTKVLPVQQYMQISCNKSHLNQTINMENRAGINLCPSVKYHLQCADCRESCNGLSVN